MKEIKELIWLNDGRTYKQIEDGVQLIPVLPKRVYNMCIDAFERIYLEEYAEDFKFEFKVYGLETRFINHVMTTFRNTSGNLGILLNGTKGTGKTVCAKILANQMNLPVIIVPRNLKGLQGFVSKISSDVILFFDEFEKSFDRNDSTILTIMDGVYNSGHRKIFLLTTNQLYINDNLLGRPSRIRYKKTFGNLSAETIKEYLDDNLIDKSKSAQILQYVDSLSISTIDILKSIVEEVNIHKCDVSEFKKWINVEQAKYSWKFWCKRIDSDEDEYGVYTLEDFKRDLKETPRDKLDSKSIWQSSTNTNSSVEFMHEGENFYYGSITQPLSTDNFMVLEDEDNSIYYLQILNIDKKPSLYRGALDYAF